MTGEVPGTRVPEPPVPASGGLTDGWVPGGSVVDRPPPNPPDWMSGVQVPELLVTRELHPGELASERTGGIQATVQRVVGLILVAILVAIVVLVLASAVSRL